MSRASFNIRKLIKPSPDNDEDEEAFECSSARTIRMQYQMEQYQFQHIQKVRHDHKHRSWMSNPSGPKTNDRWKASKPVAISGNGSIGDPSSGIASRRISTPLPLSSLSGPSDPRISPSFRSSEEDLSLLRGGDLVQDQPPFQQLTVPGISPATSEAQSPRFPKILQSAWVNCNTSSSMPILNKLSFEQAAVTHDDITHLPKPSLRALGCSLSSARQLPPTPSATRPPCQESLDKTPTNATNPAAKSATNRSNRSSYVMDGRIQQSSFFVNGQPSPPLEPDGIQSHVVDSKEMSQEMSSVSTLSLNGETAWPKEDTGLSDASDNVEQLIWETDEAFKAVSCALAEARQASHHPAPFEKMRSPLQNLQQVSHALHKQTATAKRGPTVDQPQAVSPISQTPGAGHGSDAPHRKARRAPPSLSSVPHIIKSPMSTSSVSKSKKGSIVPKAKAMRSVTHESSAPISPRESPGRGIGGHRPQHSYHKSISRLNLAADKVTDKIFDGRNGRFGFIRVEADEVVTPEQVELFRRNRIAKQLAEAKRDTYNESLRGVADGSGDERSSDGDSDGDLPPRVAHPGVDVLSPVIEVATPDSFQLNNDVLGQTTNLAVPNTPTEATKHVKVGQDPLATPPPTPPQRPIDGTEDDESMHWKSLGASKLSNRRLGHKRSASSTSHIGSLPTIPEVKITAPQGWDASRPSWQQEHKTPGQEGGRPITPTDANGNPYFEEDEEHMFFMSNNITTTMPTFQHGRIRLAKADLVNTGTINSLESKLLTSPDETLDWTAFQMAILGGAGDLFSDPDNFLSRDAQEEMVDDLCDWFEGLGFSNGDLGALVMTDKPRRATGPRTPYTPLQTAMMSTPGSGNRAFYDRKHSVDSRSSSVGSGLTRSGDSPDHSIPIPVEIEHPSGFWNMPHSDDAGRFHTGPGLKRWTLEGHPKRYQGAGIDVNRANSHASRAAGTSLPRTPGSGGKSLRASIDSLPQSPMLELRMMTGVDGNKEFVSMGYNLNHDLGDFLKWESEHVYASGFYGSE
ncbi:hypothetical protein N0V82_006888 [Gnomoniopsis sp. IMI 355080]|nr:hypothetical protein N0V82_006888 [Gnomoniopsis sp. IMI 355080]